MKDYIRLFRIKHYIKNLLVFVPIFFGRKIFDIQKSREVFSGFICFCLISSAVYILNDLCDVEKDRRHPEKCNRPLASGKISFRIAVLLLGLCLILSLVISLNMKNHFAIFFLVLYFGLNVAYSKGLKNQPIIDVVILASGFVIRTFYGGLIAGIEISKWLYLVVISGSLYIGLGKRRAELEECTDTREVLKYYSVAFLDKNMYVCVALVNVFYALWTVEMSNSKLNWMLPVFIIILMRYSLDIEGDLDSGGGGSC